MGCLITLGTNQRRTSSNLLSGERAACLTHLLRIGP